MHTTVLVMKHDAMELRAIYSLVWEGLLHSTFYIYSFGTLLSYRVSASASASL
jgi:hypothetical protein